MSVVQLLMRGVHIERMVQSQRSGMGVSLSLIHGGWSHLDQEWQQYELQRVG